MKTFANVSDCVGQVISERPYVKVLSRPRLEIDEVVPGLVQERWIAVAQVNEDLCIVELSVQEIES
jgi:hypothetical protein